MSDNKLDFFGQNSSLIKAVHSSTAAMCFLCSAINGIMSTLFVTLGKVEKDKESLDAVSLHLDVLVHFKSLLNKQRESMEELVIQCIDITSRQTIGRQISGGSTPVDLNDSSVQALLQEIDSQLKENLKELSNLERSMVKQLDGGYKSAQDKLDQAIERARIYLQK
jgi:hypothetical protein